MKDPAGECTGVIEARNKKGGFNTTDQQMARIFAHQISTAITNNKQNALLADRDQAFRKAYEKDQDKSEAIKVTQSGKFDPEDRQGDDGAPKAAIQFASDKLGVKIETQNELQQWSYDVFKQQPEALTMLFVDVFEDRGLFSRFSIDIKVFLRFTEEVMAGYDTSTPYHNYFHGFDVMHVCYLIVSTCDADGYLEDFNILSLLVGAIAHDIGHDGLNNAFHAATMSELAITYNSISIMENYSSAFLFRIITKSECNIFHRMPDSDLKKLRGRLIDMILDTDAKNHFILMTRFKHGLEMKQLSRGLLSSMILHIADVSNPTRPGPISRKWAFAVQEEFFRQGDKEKELGLAVSPFMDREYENLPRMQGAFIDALVSPVFHLTAEFLPKIANTCIKSMQVNRAFWNNLQNKQILTTPGIKDALNTGKESLSASENNDDPHEPITTPAPDDSNSNNTAIPGIPQNAPHSPGSNKRKMSLIAMRSAAEEAAAAQSLAEQKSISENLADTVLSPRSLKLKQKLMAEERRKRTAEILDSNAVQLVMLFCTGYALVADDLSLWVGDKANDDALSVVTFIVLIFFSIELVVSIYCVPEYMYFFFWLDFIAAISLIPEVGFLVGIDGIAETSSSNLNRDEETQVEDQGTITRAGRAAKAGARAGRLARVLRLIRLVRIVKLIKWMATYIKKHAHATADDEEEEVEMKMSNVGRKMTESITRKVILAVMFMLLVFSIFEPVKVPDARILQLDDMSLYYDKNASIALLMKEKYLTEYPDCFKLTGVGEVFEKSELLDVDGNHKSLRNLEQEIFISPPTESGEPVTAYFDISDETKNTAMNSFMMTTVVTILLAVLSMLFSRDAYSIMIRPIEKMKHTVQQLSENPLLHLEKLKNQSQSNAESETDMLEQAITKMARLLQIGFGSAGAEIIANNLSDGGELNPMVPGSKIEAIFGFCDIRDFTFATEGLQQDVMLFVNKIAEITHKYVVESGGAPNKNIGDAFLLVWKLATDKNSGRGDLQKELFDNALFSFMRIIRDIKRMGNLAAFLEGADEDAVWRSSLEDFKVHMGFGLHTGWAIEGSIGSKVKVDASYLSPHVNLASRLEAATKQFKVPLLMSEAFAKGLTGTTQSNCRRVDSVTFKGSSDPMHIFHYDSEPFESLKTKSPEVDELLSKCSWTEAEATQIGINLQEFQSFFASNKEAIVRQVYEMGFLSYLDGHWDKSKIILSMWLESFPGDNVALVLLDRLVRHDFKAPEDWAGFHALTEK